MPAVNVFPPRQNTTQQTNFIRRQVSFADLAASAMAAIQFGSLPLLSVITRVALSVDVAFNGGATNTVQVGTSFANANELATPADFAVGAAGYSEATRGRGNQLTQTPTGAIPVPGGPLGGVDTSEGGVGLFYKYNSTGTPPTAGHAILTVEYIPPQSD